VYIAWRQNQRILAIFLATVLFISTLIVTPVPSFAAAEDEVLYEKFEEQILTRGVTLINFERLQRNGWNKGNILKVDLSDENVETDLLSSGKTSSSSTVRTYVKNLGAIAGINGNHFDISYTKAPRGNQVQSGNLISASSVWEVFSGVRLDRIGTVGKMTFKGELFNLTNKNAELGIVNGLNESRVETGQIVVYNDRWGSASRDITVSGSTNFVELVVEDNKITQILENKLYKGEIKPNMYLVLGREKGANLLKNNFKVGDKVALLARTTPDFEEFKFALGGSLILLDKGTVLPEDGREIRLVENERHPRTAIGFDKEGKTMYLVVVDGRRKDSIGMTFRELANFMASIGCYNAMALDGGGSSTLVYKPFGQESVVVANNPSDGAERSVGNGVGVWTVAKPGELAGFVIESQSEYVFQGLSRTFTARPYDEYYNPIKVDDPVLWGVASRTQGDFEEPGVYRATSSGIAEIVVGTAKAISSKQIKVIGPPVRIWASVGELDLSGGKQASFKVYGVDPEGYQALIEPRDIALEYDASKLEVTAQKDHSLLVKPKANGGSALIKISVGELHTYVAVNMGLQTITVDNFEDGSRWGFSKYPTTGVEGAVSLVTSPSRSGKALKMTYDFTGTTVTRAAYMMSRPGPVELPGKVKKIGLWVYGDKANGHWLRGVIRDKKNTAVTIDFATSVNWTGWKYVEATVPAGVEYPISLERIYLVETAADKLDSGSIVIDDLTVVTVESVAVPEVAEVLDPMIMPPGGISQDAARFAVVSDVHLSSNQPDSKEVQNFKQVLEEINRQKVDFVLFTGDLVDSGSLGNLKFAKELIDKTLSPQIPYYVIPGDREIEGTGTTANFKQVFGSDFFSFDQKGTRYILLNTSKGSLRASNADQWKILQAAMESAKEDQRIHSLVVVGHHPLISPPSAQNSSFGDAKEAEVLKELLTEFYKESGKPAAYISGHAHGFHLQRQEGIPYVVTGPVGKAPSLAADSGGYYHYGVFGIENPGEKKTDWLKMEVRPILTDIRLELEAEQLVPGRVYPLTVLGVQRGSYEFPLGKEHQVKLEIGDDVYVGDMDEALEVLKEHPELKEELTAIVDLSKQKLYFASEGQITIGVEYGGFKKEVNLKAKIRLAGSNRYHTAVAISQEGWEKAENVVLVNGLDFPDALVGAALSHGLKAPMLLTAPDRLHPATLDEIKRLGAKNVYILGSPESVSQAVQDALAAQFHVVRIGGEKRLDTAVKVGEFLRGIQEFDTAIIVTGSNFADAMTMAPFSARMGSPILFTETDALSGDTKKALVDWKIRKVIIAGGPAAVSESVEAEIKALGIEVSRLYGDNRYLTSLKVAEFFKQSYPYEGILIATGQNFPDALAGAVLAARYKAPIVLAGKDSLRPEILNFIHSVKPRFKYILGGSTVISDELCNEIFK